MSIVTRVELEGGVYREPVHAPVRRARLDAMLSAIPALAFDDLAAKTYGTIVASAGYSRRKLLDRMIAAQALVHRATLITFTPDDFSDVPGLSSLAWPSRTPEATTDRASGSAGVGRCDGTLRNFVERLAKRFCSKVEIVNLLKVHPEIRT